MESTCLGGSSVRISLLGFGGGPLGGLFEPVDDETAAAALAVAWERGIRHFDTAPHYGIGHSERRFGDFLRQQDHSSSQLIEIFCLRQAPVSIAHPLRPLSPHFIGGLPEAT